jgi:hypothetical protein
MFVGLRINLSVSNIFNLFAFLDLLLRSDGEVCLGLN